MKTYPSIPKKLKGKTPDRRVHVFDKLDGSNLRFEWCRKQGWYRWGSRRQVIDQSHPTLGSAYRLFEDRFAEAIERRAVDQGWQGVVAFAEFWGPKSLAGQHEAGDDMKLSLFDLAPARRGMLGPERFLELFGDLDIAPYLGEHLWDEAFRTRVRQGELEGMGFEGVIGKVGCGHRLVMAKAKTQAWIDQVLRRHGEEKGRKLVNS
jgi:hypothetical protein